MSNGVFNFNLLALVFSEILGASEIYTTGPYAPWTPPSGEIFVPKASTLQYLIVFLISTFQLQQFPRFLGGPKFTLGGPVPPVRPQRKFFCTQGQYFTMSNGVFNFKFLALLLSEILGWSQIYTRRPYAPWTPSSGEILLHTANTSQYLIVFLISTFYLQQFPRFQGVPYLSYGELCLPVRIAENICTRGEYVTMSNGVFNFNFLALLLSEILGGPKFTLRGPTPPGRPLAEKFFYPK